MSDKATKARIVRDAYSCFFKGDIDGFLKDLDESGRLVEPDGLPYGGVHTGRAQIVKALTGIGQAWTDIAFDIKEVVAGESIVVAYGIFSAKGRKSGRHVEFPIAEVWTIDGGRVLEVRPIYGDTVAAIRALS